MLQVNDLIFTLMIIRYDDTYIVHPLLSYNWTKKRLAI